MSHISRTVLQLGLSHATQWDGTFRLILGMLPELDGNAAAMHHGIVPRQLDHPPASFNELHHYGPILQPSFSNSRVPVVDEILPH